MQNAPAKNFNCGSLVRGTEMGDRSVTSMVVLGIALRALLSSTVLLLILVELLPPPPLTTLFEASSQFLVFFFPFVQVIVCVRPFRWNSKR